MVLDDLMLSAAVTLPGAAMLVADDEPAAPALQRWTQAMRPRVNGVHRTI